MVRETKNLLEGRLPLEIGSRDALEDLFLAIEEEDLENGLEDIERELLFRFEIEFYDRNTGTVVDIAPDTESEVANPRFSETEKEAGSGFDIGKKEWIKRVIRGIVNSIISNAVSRYGRRFGINAPPGENAGTIEWLIRVLKIELTEEKKEIIVPPPPVVPPEIIEAIKGYERSAVALRDAAEKLRALPELREDFLKRATELEGKAKELREKYGLTGKEL